MSKEPQQTMQAIHHQAKTVFGIRTSTFLEEHPPIT